MRQMRLEKREIKDPAELEKVLDACKVVRIGTMDAEGMFIVPVNFGYEFCQKERSLKLYIHSAKEGRKAEAFAENPNVAIEMDCGHEVIRGDYTCSYSFAFSSIMGNGRIRMVENEEEKRHGLTLLMQHVEFLPHMLQRVAVYCIEVSEFTGKHREKKGQTA